MATKLQSSVVQLASPLPPPLPGNDASSLEGKGDSATLLVRGGARDIKDVRKRSGFGKRSRAARGGGAERREERGRRPDGGREEALGSSEPLGERKARDGAEWGGRPRKVRAWITAKSERGREAGGSSAERKSEVGSGAGEGREEMEEGKGAGAEEEREGCEEGR